MTDEVYTRFLFLSDNELLDIRDTQALDGKELEELNTELEIRNLETEPGWS